MFKGKTITLAGMLLCMVSFAESPVILPIPKETKILNEEITVSDSSGCRLAVCDFENSEQSKIGIEEMTKRLKELTGDQSAVISATAKPENGKFNILIAGAQSKNETVHKFIKDNGISKMPDKGQGYVIAFGKVPEWKNSVLVIGFDPAHVPGMESGHDGLASMRQRLELINGQLNIESVAGRGTTVELRVRLDAAARTPS